MLSSFPTYHSLLDPLQSPFCPYHTVKITLAKVTRNFLSTQPTKSLLSQSYLFSWHPPCVATLLSLSLVIQTTLAFPPTFLATSSQSPDQPILLVLVILRGQFLAVFCCCSINALGRAHAYSWLQLSSARLSLLWLCSCDGFLLSFFSTGYSFPSSFGAWTTFNQ